MKTLILRLLAAAGMLILSTAHADPEQQQEQEQGKAPQTDLKVSITGKSPDNRSVIVRFENTTHQPVRLLRPLDGSEWGWHMPVYDLTVTDAKGEKIPIGSRCGMSGLYADIKWPDDYRIQILPGHAYEMPVELCREKPLDGPYTITFRYHYDPKAETTKKDPSIKYPDDLWVGSAETAPTEVRFEKAQ
ncbi:MAG TPA: hypothetical protein VGE67_02145 [Haloferula sp.]